MEKEVLLSEMKETLKTDPAFKDRILEEIELMENTSVDREIESWAKKTSNK